MVKASSSVPAFRRSRAKLVVVALLVLAAGVAVGMGVLRGKRAAAVHPKRGSLVEKVVTTGRVLAQARVQLGSTLMAQVAEVKVDEGDRVRAGDLLVRLQDQEQLAAIAQARAAIARTKVMVNRVSNVSRSVSQQRLDEAASTLALAEQDYRRTVSLSQAGAVPPTELERVEQALKAAKARATSAEVETRSAQPGGSDHQVASAAVGEAGAQLALAQARLAQTRIVAPSDAIVLTRSVEPGDVVRAGQILLVLARIGPTRLSVQVDEKDLAVLRLGQRGRALADALPDRPFDAQLSFIAPEVDADRGTIEVRMDVPSPPADLRPDMTVSVNIEIARRGNVLLLPENALHDLKKAEPWVLVAVQGRAERRPVRLGAHGDGLVEVKSGVSEQDNVLLVSANVEAGQRVRPMEPGLADAI
jgi:HlyD family secretion protein